MKKSARETLADNLWRLIAAYPGNAKKQARRPWALAHKIDEKKLHRALKGDDVQLVATIQELADQLRVEPWQLLHPEFEAARRPAPVGLSAQALDVALALDRIGDETRRQKTYALMIQLAEFENSPASLDTPQPSPAPTPKPVRHR